MIKDLLKCIADQVLTSRHIEFYLTWSWEIMLNHGTAMQRMSDLQYLESIRALIRAVSVHEKQGEYAVFAGLYAGLIFYSCSTYVNE